MDIFNEVCKDLPERYSFLIEMENGSASLWIRHPDGRNIDWYIDDTPFDEQIKAAVQWCIEDSESNFTPPRYDAVFRKGTEELNKL